MYDFVVVGSGIAGLYTALLAQRHGRVLLLAKSRLEDTNTNHAQGGIAAPVDADDSPEHHWRDTMGAGAGLNDPVATWVLVSEACARIDDLLAFGVPFDRERGRLALGREAAHGAARVLHARGDGTGASVQATLSRLAREARNVTILEHHEVSSLIVSDGAVRGVIAESRGREVRFGGRAVILATGGAGQLYERTTNPKVATGSGIALAYLAGAAVADLEFCQFHPTALALPGAPCFLISEAVRGEGAILRNAEGRRFMPEYDPRGELAPRHVVANAMRAEMSRLGAAFVYLDLAHLPRDLVLRRFPGIAAFCRDFDLDITRQPIPVAPAAHYMMGGVRTDTWGRTDIPGLFACGEVACTGVHGANRLASNSLLEGLVFGSRIVRYLTGEAGSDERRALPDEVAERASPGKDQRWGPLVELRGRSAKPNLSLGPWPVLKDVQRLMWQCAGMERSRQSLLLAADTLAGWSRALGQSRNTTTELRYLVLVARLVVDAALSREESRGAHYRSDFPESDPTWRKRMVYRDAVAAQGSAMAFAGR